MSRRVNQMAIPKPIRHNMDSRCSDQLDGTDATNLSHKTNKPVAPTTTRKAAARVRGPLVEACAGALDPVPTESVPAVFFHSAMALNLHLALCQ